MQKFIKRIRNVNIKRFVIHKKNVNLVLVLIFAIALVIRFLYFKESTYFGYDEARDAYTSLSIYQHGDFKLIGPSTTYPGLYHGPLHWYLIGPMYLFSNGNPYVVSAIFRIINALGVFLIYFITKKLFDTKSAIISALIYAFSFEQTQYAMFVSNPTLAVIAWMLIFLGTAIVVKNKNPFGLILMAIGASVATQLELIYLYTFILVIILLFISRKEIKKFTINMYFSAISIAGLLLSTYIVAEIKYHFQSIKALIELLTTRYHIVHTNDFGIVLYGKMFFKLFQYNILNIPFIYLIPLIVVFIGVLCYSSRNNISLRIVLIWIFASTILLPLGGYDALYFNLGIGLGVIVGCAYLLSLLWKKNVIIAVVLLLIVLISNISLVLKNNSNSLIVELKPQSFMKLKDEIKIVDKMYGQANGKDFTIRVTGIPYSIQTTWAFLFNYYGQKEWGYLPYWEGQMVSGFPGSLPTPTKGTTCIRYLIRDPIRGLPQNIIQRDLLDENYFSNIVKEEKIGEFLLQTRMAGDKNCIDNKVK